MERNQIIGIVLIMATFMLWTISSAPSKEELEKSKRTQDSIALVQQTPAVPSQLPDSLSQTDEVPVKNDSLSLQANGIKFGAFGVAANGSQEDVVLENDLMRVTLTNKAGIIKEVLLKKHYKTITDSTGKEGKELVTMLNSPENKFNYTLPVPGALNKAVNTSDLYFTTNKQGSSGSFKADAGNGAYFEQKYTLSPDNYTIDYAIHTHGLGNIVASNTKAIPLNCENYIKKYEKGEQFEQNYATVYYKQAEEKRDDCSCVSDDSESLSGKEIEWVAHTNQFFNTSLVAKTVGFTNAELSTKMTDYKTNKYLKVIHSEIGIPINNMNEGQFDMVMYVGPNEFKRLKALVLVDSHCFDFFVLGWQLLDGSGIDLARKLRQSGRVPFAPIVLLTSSPSAELSHQAGLAGVTELFPKQDVEELVAFIRHFFEMNQPMNCKLLYIEDAKEQRQLMSGQLSDWGISVDGFSNADDAWLAFLGNDYDLVLSDIFLGGHMSGARLINRIRRQPLPKGGTPIVAVTAFDTPARRIELFHLGVADYVHKPIIPVELRARLQNLLTRKKATERNRNYRSR